MSVFKQANQAVLFYVSAAFLLLIPLAYLRKNEEFIFFSGILFSLMIASNQFIYRDRTWLTKYIALALVYLSISFIIGKSAFSLRLPLVTIAVSTFFHALFYLVLKRHPSETWRQGSNADRIYRLLLMTVLIVTWIALIVTFVEK